MTVLEIQVHIEKMEKDFSLYDERNFEQRTDALDFLGYHIIGQIEDLLRKPAQTDQLVLLKKRAEKIHTDLTEIDVSLFGRLQADIRIRHRTGQKFEDLIREYVDFNFEHRENLKSIGYDNLDLFINGITHFETLPEQTTDLEPEMVFYQKTPVRIIFELVKRYHFNKEDIFFDLGSGFGQVVILFNLLTGITAKGVEIDASFCNYARNCTKELNLSNVTFVNIDARRADYTEGTIFFMFTPFKGQILGEVLAILKEESSTRKIKLVTYGPCTAQIALHDWLTIVTPQDNYCEQKLCVFSSL